MKKSDSSVIEIFTDGACRGNPGPGGWGAVVRRPGLGEETLRGAEAHTTNNRMELQAAIQALLSLQDTSEVSLTTDSQYVRKGISEWMEDWKRRGWKTADKKPVKNADLWQLLDAQNKRHHVQWHWVRSHNGHRENEMADALANQAIDELLSQTCQMP